MLNVMAPEYGCTLYFHIFWHADFIPSDRIPTDWFPMTVSQNSFLMYHYIIRWDLVIFMCAIMDSVIGI
jgi:hypothetical protein